MRASAVRPGDRITGTDGRDHVVGDVSPSILEPGHVFIMWGEDGMATGRRFAVDETVPATAKEDVR